MSNQQRPRYPAPMSFHSSSSSAVLEKPYPVRTNATTKGSREAIVSSKKIFCSG
jgi:hypothetical protein